MSLFIQNTNEKKNMEQKIRHLYLRAGFGIPPYEAEYYHDHSVQKAVEGLFEASANASELKPGTDLHPPAYYRKDLKMVMSKDERKKLVKQQIVDEGEMNVLWVKKMAAGDEALREKMTLFWHGHFACRDFIALYALNLNNTIRRHALGNFGDMLIAVSKEPAMLRYLNNQQNKKQHPNENFAREVMELFTIGRGNYTEDDVKNAARAFTGWTADGNGNFIVRPLQHDSGIKTFMGHTGNFDGEDILKIILSRRETARYMAAKVYRYFVNQENPDEEIITTLGKQFYESDYDISALLKNIFTAEWFYSPRNMGNRIKSPIELIVGLKRDLKLEFETPAVEPALQKLLGQVLFNPPNVAGWAGGRTWIDSSTLLYRMKLPESLLVTSGMDVSIKDDPTENARMAAINKKILKNMKCNVDLSAYNSMYRHTETGEMVDSLAAALLPPGAVLKDRQMVIDFVKNTGDDPVKAALMRICSLPEYQLC